jgi:hypothetical protein
MHTYHDAYIHIMIHTNHDVYTMLRTHHDTCIPWYTYTYHDTKISWYTHTKRTMMHACHDTYIHTYHAYICSMHVHIQEHASTIHANCMRICMHMYVWLRFEYTADSKITGAGPTVFNGFQFSTRETLKTVEKVSIILHSAVAFKKKRIYIFLRAHSCISIYGIRAVLQLI